MAKIIENVVLKEIRKEDGAQKFTAKSGNFWLYSWNRGKNVKVGDTGRLEYRSDGKNYGMFFFVKDEIE